MVNPDNIFGRLGNKMFQGAYIYSQFKDGNIPDIYVQDFSLFEKYEGDIKKLYGDGIGFLPYVSIHVRRGDYVDNPFYVDLLKTDYYKRAIALFPDKNFLVFSDDPEYCKTLEMFKGDNFQVMEDGNELEDFNQMASCENNICANSSFSIWAAYLNPAWNKQVIVPKEWFTDKIERVKLPQEWTRI